MPRSPVRNDPKARALVEMVRAQQRAAGAAPDKAGYEDPRTQAGTKNYMRQLNGGYVELNDAVVDVMARRPPKDGAGWDFINRWLVTYGEWRKFYDDTIDDWIITTDDEEEANDFGRRLDKDREGYKTALHEKAPGDPVPKPSAPQQDEPTSTLDQATNVLKWGVVAFVVFKVGSVVLSKDKG